jgi:hypothetical protein
MLTNTGKDHEVRAPVHENPLVAGLIRQIAESDVFRAAPVMRKLLLYLWQNRAESISEYAIATEALGRAPDFDSRTDASVRVLIARLRAKLNEFYARAGDDFQLLLSIPVGGHQIEWSLKNDAVKEPVEPVAVPAVPVPDELAWRRPFVVAAAAAAILALVCIVLAISLVRLRNSPAPVPPLPRFWKAFMASGKPADIVIPDQTGFRWQDQGIYVIDPRTPDFEKWRDSPVLRGLADKWGPPISTFGSTGRKSR